MPKEAHLDQALCGVIIGGFYIYHYVLQYSVHMDAVDGFIGSFMACSTIVHAAIGLWVAGRIKYGRLNNRFPGFFIILVFKRYYKNIIIIWKQMQQNTVPKLSIYAMVSMFFIRSSWGVHCVLRRTKLWPDSPVRTRRTRPAWGLLNPHEPNDSKPPWANDTKWGARARRLRSRKARLQQTKAYDCGTGETGDARGYFITHGKTTSTRTYLRPLYPYVY